MAVVREPLCPLRVLRRPGSQSAGRRRNPAVGAGNHAGACLAQQAAADAGCQQDVWLDPVERRWVEERGGMNLIPRPGDRTGRRRGDAPADRHAAPRRDSRFPHNARGGSTACDRRMWDPQWHDLLDCRPAIGVSYSGYGCGEDEVPKLGQGAACPGSAWRRGARTLGADPLVWSAAR
ncbi:hypothetical protein SSPO_100340 [Streptomyces antimycoticus]|uniref:Uncharacterized protein n=1 Tax=Streptomyces antimycoticus TaxID=68175 RepID=A0A499VGK3_9ACTN|nr:hypothetical protein SSPO_100340 [Streptomyces antimycoticus]